MTVRQFWLTVRICLTLLLPAGTTLSQTSVPSKAPRSEEKVHESLSRVVYHQLLMLPYYSVFDSLTFSISGDKVTLSGQVLRPTLKAHAEAAIKSIEGVGGVVNNIEVLPSSSSDDELRRNVYHAIFEDTVLAKYAIQAVPPIHIIVKNGGVKLEGVVDDEADVALAAKEASKVPNVASLENQLTVRIRDAAAK